MWGHGICLYMCEWIYLEGTMVCVPVEGMGIMDVYVIRVCLLCVCIWKTNAYVCVQNICVCMSAERAFQEEGTGCAKTRGVTKHGMIGAWQQQSRDGEKGRG